MMGYRKKGGEEELDVVKEDALRVFKRYNHWSYVCPTPSLLCSSILIGMSIRRLRKQTASEAGCPAGLLGKSADRALHQATHRKRLELHTHTPTYRPLQQRWLWNQPNYARG